MKRRLLFSLVGIVVLAFGTLATNLILGNKPQLGLDLQGGASITYRPVSSDYNSDALAEVSNLYRERIESLNVGEAEVVRQGDTIIVNLPGVKDQEAAIALIGTTGKVTFRPVLQRAGGFENLTVPATGPTAGPESLITVPQTPAGTNPSTPVVEPGTTVAPAGGPSRLPSQESTTVPTVAPAAPTTVAPAAPTTVAGPTTTVDPSSFVTPADQDQPESEVFLPDRNGTVLYQLGPQFAVGEDAVSTATAEVNQTTGAWQVALTLTAGDGGLGAWNRAAAACYAKAPTCADGGMAIIIDHRVISAPVPQTPTFDSASISITGSFPESEAKGLARVLKYGATPVEMAVEASQTVSATLGKDSLRAGIVAGAIGVALVLMFMLFYYRKLALVVVAGVCVSGAIIWSMITMFDNFFVLTLAGVTGIIVSIGVTVDSYVVFFERLKDEVRDGRTFRNSAQRGFSAAWRTILAADFVSLLGATVLWYLSVGSVRGFALFLGLSTVCDMVVAWFFTRPAVILLSRRRSFQGASILGLPSGDAIPITSAVTPTANVMTGGVA